MRPRLCINSIVFSCWDVDNDDEFVETRGLTVILGGLFGTTYVLWVAMRV
jgi:hypothetical protein